MTERSVEPWHTAVTVLPERLPEFASRLCSTGPKRLSVDALMMRNQGAAWHEMESPAQAPHATWNDRLAKPI